MTGLWVVVAVVALVGLAGLIRSRTDGRTRSVSPREALDAQRLGTDLGSRATLVQFSSPACAPCRTTRVALAAVAADEPGVVHLEVDAASRLDLARDFGVLRTPTTLVLDSVGVVRQRISGPADRRLARDALAALS